jgi:hypothetical protein
MATVLEEYSTEEHRSVVRCYGKKDSMQRIFIKKYFLFMVVSVCRVKPFTNGSRNSLKDVRKSQILRQQSKDFYAVGFDALVKRWDKCTNIDGGYVKK